MIHLNKHTTYAWSLFKYPFLCYYCNFYLYIICYSTTNCADKLAGHIHFWQIKSRVATAIPTDWATGPALFKLELEGAVLKVDGSIVFSEKANDFTTIVGEYHEEIPVKELEKCRSCSFSLEDSYGVVSGPNIGARGYRWYQGQGLVRRAKIITDTFGDSGRIGGTVKLNRYGL